MTLWDVDRQALPNAFGQVQIYPYYLGENDIWTGRVSS